jgi:3-hydroxyisobutyrate dehydrogenase
MGQGIASSLLRRGYRVQGWNRSKAKAAALIDAGVIWAASPAAAARGASAVFSMVADDGASEAVWLGAEGALGTMKAGTLMVECSTLSAPHVARLAAAARDRELIYIDCPVTGLPDEAEQGRLTLLVGAEFQDLERARPFLDPLASVIRHFGAPGTGTAYKLIINLMGAVQIAALAEGLALAERLGLDRETVISSIETSAAASPQVVRHTRRMAEKRFDAHPSFTVALRHKDAAYGLALAETTASPATLGVAAEAWFALAKVTDADRDEACVINAIAR